MQCCFLRTEQESVAVQNCSRASVVMLLQCSCFLLQSVAVQKSIGCDVGALQLIKNRTTVSCSVVFLQTELQQLQNCSRASGAMLVQASVQRVQLCWWPPPVESFASTSGGWSQREASTPPKLHKKLLHIGQFSPTKNSGGLERGHPPKNFSTTITTTTTATTNLTINRGGRKRLIAALTTKNKLPKNQVLG